MSVMTRMDKLEERKPELTERDLDERIEMKVNEALEEMQEREKRRMNVVFVNVPESEADTPEERKKEDLEKIATIVRTVSDVTKDDMTDPTRLGAKVIGKDKRPRMLRMTVRNEETKKKLLTNARKIEGKGRDRVYINQDRTPKEREIFRKLREELMEKRKENHDLVIRDNKIVPKRGGEGQGAGRGGEEGKY